MIRLLEKYDGSGLRDSHYSRVILSHLSAYGTGYGFCRFYEITGSRRAGIIALFNGSAAADFTAGGRITREMKRELAEFCDFQQLETFELPKELTTRRGIGGMTAVSRRFFEIAPSESSEGIFSPEPEYVFKTVYSGADADYGLWLTDTLHRINAGKSRLYGYKTSVLTVRFVFGGRAYITDVATPPEDRGKGQARALLGGTAKLLAADGFKAYLSAEPDSAGYYEKLGCRDLGADKIYQRK